MAIRTYKVTLDTKNTIAPEPVFLRQGDKTGAVVIDATLMDNGSPVSLSGLTPMFKANTADGQAVIADSTGFNVVDESGGEFTYQVPNALAAVPGKIMTAYFSLSDASGSESTFDVAFIIKKAVDITKPQADDYITIIDGTLQSLQQKIDAMNNDVQTILNAYNQGDFYNKSETDSRDASTLASAKSYADSGDSATLTGANSYADSINNSITQKINDFSKVYTRTITSSDIIDSAGISNAEGVLVRIGNCVSLSFHGVAGAPLAGTDAQQILNIPSGYRPSFGIAGQFALAISESITAINAQRGFIGGENYTVYWRVAQGSAYLSGTWVTSDAAPS